MEVSLYLGGENRRFREKSADNREESEGRGEAGKGPFLFVREEEAEACLLVA